MNSFTWNRIWPLFENDDGSLPDIFIEGLTDEQTVQIYNWVLDRSSIYGEPTLWSIVEEKDIPVREIENPAQMFIDRKVEPFRHGLDNLVIEKVELPGLSICVEAGGVSFDYRMGADWTKSCVEALFKFLSMLKSIGPNARVFQADEGGHESPNSLFEEAFQEYMKTHNKEGLEGRLAPPNQA